VNPETDRNRQSLFEALPFFVPFNGSWVYLRGAIESLRYVCGKFLNSYPESITREVRNDWNNTDGLDTGILHQQLYFRVQQERILQNLRFQHEAEMTVAEPL
jgi:hypothetical protein